MAYGDISVSFPDRPRAQVTYGRAYTLTCKVYSDGTQVVPTGGTIDVKRPGNAPLTSPVSGASVSIDGNGTMTYSLAAGNADLLAVHYAAVWHPVISGVTYDFPQLFDVVRYPLRNMVTQDDLVKHHKDLTDLLFTGETDHQVYIEQAFEDVFQWLDSKGNRPALVLTGEDLRRPIEHLALHKKFIAIAKEHDPPDRWRSLADYHRSEYERWIQSAAFVYDVDQSGSADGTSTEDTTGEEGSRRGALRYGI